MFVIVQMSCSMSNNISLMLALWSWFVNLFYTKVWSISFMIHSTNYKDDVDRPTTWCWSRSIDRYYTPTHLHYTDTSYPRLLYFKTTFGSCGPRLEFCLSFGLWPSKPLHSRNRQRIWPKMLHIWHQWRISLGRWLEGTCTCAQDVRSVGKCRMKIFVDSEWRKFRKDELDTPVLFKNIL